MSSEARVKHKAIAGDGGEISASGEGLRPSYLSFLLAASALIGLYVTSLYDYILFHSLVELFSIAVAWGIFMIAWNSRTMLDNDFLLFLGISFLFVGGLDLLHTLSYKGMGVFPNFNADPPTQLWIAARYMQSISVIVAAGYISRSLKPGVVVSGFITVTALLLLSIFLWKIFPICYVEGVGLTPFKKLSEYVIALILAFSLPLLYRKKDVFDPVVFWLVFFSVLLTIISELMFTTYISVYGLSNLIGHFFKVASFYVIYAAIIKTGLVKPYNVIFRKLKQSEKELEQKVRERTAELRQVNEELELEIVERKKAEEEIRLLNLDLEQRVQERTIALESANRELEAFSYSASHDLKAPLRSLDGFSTALIEDYSDVVDERGKDYLERLRSASRRMSELIDGLLCLSSVSRSKLRKEVVDLSAMAQTVKDELSKEDPGRRVDFIIAPGLRANGDPSLLRTVLQNLLGNAWKFTAREPEPRVEFGVTEDSAEQVFFVSDNGAGFNMLYAGRLFAPFQRMHSQTDFPGSGIGLSTVQRIVTRHGGRIWAESEPGKGAVFYFTIP